MYCHIPQMLNIECEIGRRLVTVTFVQTCIHFVCIVFTLRCCHSVNFDSLSLILVTVEFFNSANLRVCVCVANNTMFY